MDDRMQRLYAPVHDLREAGLVGHVDDGDAGLAQGPGGAARGQDLCAEGRQCLSERHEATLVRDAQQRPFDFQHLVPCVTLEKPAEIRNSMDQ